MSASGSDESVRFWGLLVSRKVDVVALTALLLSIGAISFQLSIFFRGAELRLLPPDQVFIVRDTVDYPASEPRARFGATLIYVNRGEKGYSAIIRREVAQIRVGSKDYEQGWDGFVTFEGGAGDLEPKDFKPAKPFVVDGGDSQSHETYFIPWPVHCPEINPTGACNRLANHIYWANFIAELRRLVKEGHHQFRFVFAAELIGASPIKASCEIDIDQATVEDIATYGSYNPTCFPDYSADKDGRSDEPPMGVAEESIYGASLGFPL